MFFTTVCSKKLSVNVFCNSASPLYFSLLSIDVTVFLVQLVFFPEGVFTSCCKCQLETEPPFQSETEPPF